MHFQEAVQLPFTNRLFLLDDALDLGERRDGHFALLHFGTDARCFTLIRPCT